MTPPYDGLPAKQPFPALWNQAGGSNTEKGAYQMKNANKEACHCKNVTYAQIQNAVRQGARTLEEVQKRTGCGTGCGQCREFIQYLIRDLVEEEP